MWSRCGASRGASSTTEQSTLTGPQPTARSRADHLRQEVEDCRRLPTWVGVGKGRPAHRGPRRRAEHRRPRVRSRRRRCDRPGRARLPRARRPARAHGRVVGEGVDVETETHAQTHERPARPATTARASTKSWGVVSLVFTASPGTTTLGRRPPPPARRRRWRRHPPRARRRSAAAANAWGVWTRERGNDRACDDGAPLHPLDGVGHGYAGHGAVGARDDRGDDRLEQRHRRERDERHRGPQPRRPLGGRPPARRARTPTGSRPPAHDHVGTGFGSPHFRLRHAPPQRRPRTERAAASAQSRTRRSPSISYCFRAPKRVPLPAATTTAQAVVTRRRQRRRACGRPKSARWR